MQRSLSSRTRCYSSILLPLLWCYTYASPPVHLLQRSSCHSQALVSKYRPQHQSHRRGDERVLLEFEVSAPAVAPMCTCGGVKFVRSPQRHRQDSRRAITRPHPAYPRHYGLRYRCGSESRSRRSGCVCYRSRMRARASATAAPTDSPPLRSGPTTHTTSTCRYALRVRLHVCEGGEG